MLDIGWEPGERYFKSNYVPILPTNKVVELFSGLSLPFGFAMLTILSPEEELSNLGENLSSHFGIQFRLPSTESHVDCRPSDPLSYSTPGKISCPFRWIRDHKFLPKLFSFPVDFLWVGDHKPLFPNEFRICPSPMIDYHHIRLSNHILIISPEGGHVNEHPADYSTLFNSL